MSPSPSAHESSPQGMQVCHECKTQRPCSNENQRPDVHWYCYPCWQTWQGVSESQSAPAKAEPPVQAYDTSLEEGQYRYKRRTVPVAGGQQMGNAQIIEAARTHGLLQGTVMFREFHYASGEIHTIVFKDHSRNMSTSRGSVTICISQGGTVTIAGTPSSQKMMLKKI